MAWIATLSPAEELAVRMAFRLSNPWCHDDERWQRRIAELESKFITCDRDRRRYQERAAKMARDLEGALQELKAQMAVPAAAPNTPA